MSEDTQIDTTKDSDAQSDEQPSERELLMERADDLGISYSKNIKTETLKERVNAKLSGSDSDSEDDAEESPAQAKAREAKERRAVQDKAGKLCRVRITCMNPNKRNHEGEYFSAANAYTGTFTKYVPYDTEWHVPQMILNMIRARKVAVRVDKTVDGVKRKVTKLISEFAVEELPPLTDAELKQLKLEQARRNGNSDE